MLISYEWLREYIGDPSALPPPAALAEALTMSGTEVEGLSTPARLEGVVTAEILSIGPHPNADRLSLCEVSTGDETLAIVCGAKNIKAGDKVALALVGARLPNPDDPEGRPFKIKKSKIRGVYSHGMICSEVELGIKDTSEGVMILAPETQPGRDINDALGLGETMMEACITPNRADLLSIRGMAREAAAVTGAVFKDRDVKVEEGNTDVASLVSVEIAPDAPCARYSARVIEGVTVAPSPDCVRSRLEAHGIRPVNNVVDATNYVLIESGSPLHAFDMARLKGGRINVRPAREGESIVAIDGSEVALDPSMLVIADDSDPVALAGVMGGRASEVTEATTDILLEAAWFEPAGVRRTSKKTGISTESSYRFERGVDIDGVVRALDMAAEMIRSLAGGSVAKGRIDVYPERFAPATIEFGTVRAAALLGTGIEEGLALEIFKRLGFEIKGISPSGTVSVVVPPYRRDLKTETDLVEEVARLHGYGRIPTVMPVAALASPVAPAEVTAKTRVRETLTGAGMSEALNYAFVSPGLSSLSDPAGLYTGRTGKAVGIRNPLSEEQSVLRTSLLPSLLENLRRNIQRRTERVRIFETAPVFTRAQGTAGVDERWMVSGLIYGTRWPKAWNYPGDPIDFFDAKGMVEGLLCAMNAPGAAAFKTGAAGYEELFHPGRCATVLLDDAPAGVLGETHPDIMKRFDLKRPASLFELDLGSIGSGVLSHGAYRSVPKFPASARDIAFIIDARVPYAEIINSITGLDAKIIEKVELFDVYYGGSVPEGKRSMALRVVYRSAERTLTGAEVEGVHAKVAGVLAVNFGAQVRGPE